MKHVHKQEDITDIIIAGDLNSGIDEEEIEQFYNQIGVFNIFSFLYDIPENEREQTQNRGSRCIKSVGVSAGLLGVIEGCIMINYLEIIITDHRGFIVDLNIEEYFGARDSVFDRKNIDRLDLTRKTHGEYFVDRIESIVDDMGLETYIQEIEQTDTENLNKFKLERIDREFTYLFQNATSYVLGPNKNILDTNKNL